MGFRLERGGRMFHEYPDILTVRQLAQALDISVNSAYKLIHQREIGCKRVGRKILVPKQCLIDYVRSARYTVTAL